MTSLPTSPCQSSPPTPIGEESDKLVNGLLPQEHVSAALAKIRSRTESWYWERYLEATGQEPRPYPGIERDSASCEAKGAPLGAVTEPPMEPTVESVLAMYRDTTFEELVEDNTPVFGTLEYLILGRAEYQLFVTFATMNKHVYTGQGGLAVYKGMEVLRSNAVSKIKVV